MPNIDLSNLKVGIVGAGLMGRWHTKYARRLGVQVVSILDHDLTLATKLAKESDGANAYSKLEAMLSSEQLDVIHICTPLDSHFQLVSQAITAGVHVFVEKPLAMTAAETQTLLELAAEYGVTLCPVHQFGFQKGVFDSLARMDSLGDLLHLRFTVASAGAEGGTEKKQDEIIADVIPHPLSILQRLRPGIELNTQEWTGVHARAGELNLTGNTDGTIIDIAVSMNARPTRCQLELFFSQGKIFLNLFHGYAVIETGEVSRVQKMIQPLSGSLKEFFIASTNLLKRSIKSEPAYPGLTQLLENFYISIVNKTHAPISPAEILAVAAARDDISKRFLNIVSDDAEAIS